MVWLMEIQVDLVVDLVEIMLEAVVMHQDQVVDQTTQTHHLVDGVIEVDLEIKVPGAVLVAVAVLVVLVVKVMVVDQIQKEEVLVVQDYHIL